MSEISSVQNWPDEPEAARYAFLEKLTEIINQVNGLSNLNLAIYKTTDAAPTDPGFEDEIVLRRGKIVQGTIPNQYIVWAYTYVGGSWRELKASI